MESAGNSRIRRLAIVGLALFAPVLHVVGAGGARVNMGLADPLVLAAIPWILWRFLTRQARLPLFVCALAMAAGALLSTLSHFEISFYVRSPLGLTASLLKALFVWAYFYAAVNLAQSRDDLLLLTKTWILGSGALALCGIAGSAAHQWMGTENPFSLAYRAQGTMGDPNLFSTHLGVSFFLSLFYLSVSGRKRAWVFVVMALELGGMLMSASRSGLLGFMAGLGMLFLFRASAKWKLAVATGMAAIVVAALAIPEVRQLAVSNPITERLATTTVDVRETDRLKLWEVAWNNFRGAPLFGVGYENGSYVNRSLAGTASEAHNTYLSIASELGIGGITTFLIALLYFPAALLRDTKGPRLSDRRNAAWLLVEGFVNIAVVGIALNADNYRGLWMLMGIAYWFRVAYLAEGKEGRAPEEGRSADGAATVAHAAC